MFEDDRYRLKTIRSWTESALCSPRANIELHRPAVIVPEESPSIRKSSVPPATMARLTRAGFCCPLTMSRETLSCSPVALLTRAYR